MGGGVGSHGERAVLELNLRSFGELILEQGDHEDTQNEPNSRTSTSAQENIVQFGVWEDLFIRLGSPQLRH